MTAFIIWFLGVVICGFSICIIIVGLSLHKEAIVELLFEKDFGISIIFSCIAFLFDGVGGALFYLGYLVMEHNIA